MPIPNAFLVWVARVDRNKNSAARMYSFPDPQIGNDRVFAESTIPEHRNSSLLLLSLSRGLDGMEKGSD
jgi:hypothetical protein